MVAEGVGELDCEDADAAGCAGDEDTATAIVGFVVGGEGAGGVGVEGLVGG